MAANVIYPPNLDLLSNRPSSPEQAVSPTYRTTPAPMGLADYGLEAGGSTYSVYASDVLGTIQLNDYNSSAGPLYEDTGAYYWDYESPYENSTPWQSAVQLNTVVTNVSYPGANNGSFWTQNVLEFQGSHVQLVDNLWNLSNPYEYLAWGTLYSYGGFAAYPEFYYDYGPTLPVVYPMTIQLYNNASIVDGRSAVTFGYRVTEPGHVYAGDYDQVVFNSTPNASVPLLTPDYLVSGTNVTPAGLLYDAELVFGGPGSGSNAVITSLSGSEAIAYDTAAGWAPASATYDYGTDTAETSVGFAGWYSGSREFVNQGPSILYGLWNTTGGVPPGNLEVNLVLDPSYQFVFIGRNGTDAYNESYAPSTAGGTLQTWLPPGVYNISDWADGFDPLYGQFDTSLSGTFELTPDAAVWDAPIYLNGPAQAEAFGIDATGWSGSGPIPIVNLTVNVSLVFNHLNDYGYTEFGLFWAYGFGSPQLYVSSITQGSNLGGQTLYVGDEPGQVLNIPELGDTIQAWDVRAPEFSDLTLPGVDFSGTEAGGAVAVWDAPGATAFFVNSTNGSFGFWAANSEDVSDTDSNATAFGTAFTVMASPDAVGTNLGAGELGYSVFSEGSDHGTFENVQALTYSVGYQGFASNGTEFSTVVADLGSSGLDLQGDSNDRVADVFANTGSLGVFGNEAPSLSITGMYATTGSSSILSWGAKFYGGNWTNLTDLSTNDAAGAEFLGGANDSVTNADFLNNSIGLFFIETGRTSVENLTANNSLGVFLEVNVAPATANDVTAIAGGIGFASFLSQAVACSDVIASAQSSAGPTTTGVLFEDDNDSSASDVVAEGPSIGVDITTSTLTTVTNVGAYAGGTGVVVDRSTGVNVSEGYAAGGATGVVADGSSVLALNDLTANGADGAVLQQTSSVRLTGTTATNGGVGVLGQDVTDARLNSTDAQNDSLGVSFDGGEDLWINDTTVSNGSVGVDLKLSDDAWVSGVSATGASTSGPYRTPSFGVPTAAVVTQETDQVVISGLSASGYPAGLYDDGSEDLVATGVHVSNGAFGVILNGTRGGLFYGLSLVSDQVGLQLNQDATLNVVTESAFRNNVGYGVDIASGSGNRVYANTFSGNDGATSAYSALHIQAYSASPNNWFNTTSEIGNYWSDWHTYANGVLAPYFVGNGAWDYYPLGVPAGQRLVSFHETGLPVGANWSVTLNGTVEASTTGTISVSESPGSYAFSIAVPAGWTVSPESGTVTVTSGGVVINVTASAIDTVTFSETGLSDGTGWSVVLDGIEHTSTGATVTFAIVGGTYAYTVVAPAGYAATPPNGTLAVGGSYLQPVTFRLTNPPSPKVTVNVEETGLPTGTSWTAYVGGTPVSGTAATLSLEVNANSSYRYQATSILATYSAAPGTISVQGSTYDLLVAFHPVLYGVTFSESGLVGGTSWTVEVDGATYTETGPSVTVELTNGSFSYAFGPVAGYSLPETGASGSVTINGQPASVSTTYSSTAAAPSYVPKSTFNTDLALAVAVAAAAVVVAVAGLLRPPRARTPRAATRDPSPTASRPPANGAGADGGPEAP